MSSTIYRLILVAILLLAFDLRVHDLGRDGLWLDEAGQALAATESTLPGMITVERTHAMAMPLDYLVTRAAAWVGQSEWILRFPALAWGMAAVAAVGALAKQATGQRRVAAFAALLMATSPAHVYFSQELRFYSALVFWYLLSSLLLFRALRTSMPRRWWMFIMVSAAGVYFHPYVLLALVGGGVYLLLQMARGQSRRTEWRAYILSGLVLVLIFLPGYWVFGRGQDYHFDPLQWAGSLDRVILGGLEWTTTLYGRPSLSLGALIGLNALFAIVGLVSAARHRRWMLVSLAAGSLLSIAVILLAVLSHGYWLLGRQLVQLAPIIMILTATGVVAAADVVTGTLRGRTNRPALPAVVVPLVLGVFMLIVLGAESDRLYARPRNSGREVALALIARHDGQSPIFVIPAYDRQSYAYYFRREGHEEMTFYLQGTTLDALQRDATEIERATLALSLQLTTDQLAELQTAGFVSNYTLPGLFPESRYKLFEKVLP